MSSFYGFSREAVRVKVKVSRYGPDWLVARLTAEIANLEIRNKPSTRVTEI